MADVWAALEAAEREPSIKPAAKGKGAGAGQQGQSSTDHVFGLLDVGLNGEVEVEMRPATYKPPLPPLTDISPYPLLPIEEDPKLFIRKNYLDIKPEQLRHIQPARRYWPRTVQESDLYHLEPSRPTLTLDVITDPQTGEIRGFREVEVGDTTSTATNSTSLVRAPGSLDDFARGSSHNLPFKPGGLGEETKEAYETRVASLQAALNFDQGLRSVPPGFEHGLIFEAKTGAAQPGVVAKKIEKAPAEKKGLFQLSANSLIGRYADVDVKSVLDRMRNREGRRGGGGGDKGAGRGMFDPSEEDYALMAPAKPAAATEEPEEEQEEEDSKSVPTEKPAAGEQASSDGKEVKLQVPQLGAPAAAKNPLDSSLDELLGAEDTTSLLDRRSRQRRKKGEEVWALLDSVDVSNFTELVPKMALEYPFDLDTFQKEAVYHLENSESVFVAAHTSAGKTVVAEYAIALCMKHMTRAIYTSPIKALSNQKYRDFKNTFGDVGIITGDVQVNQTASCLIVTTEILRSMLYKGADLIRDVEWVIFDEVHYINDLERGVVWEEVIIMLPAHVNLILLSATVPNTFEFADWIGRTKKKKVFVISTHKRPTPLEHYLWANDEMYKVVDGRDRTFLSLGYKGACESFKEKQKPTVKGAAPKQNFVPAAARMKAELAQWNKVVRTLRDKNLLPVVVFSFSKRRCEDCAYGLANIDLSSGKEKSEIHVFFEQSMNRLKPPDRKLPQVLRIKELLKRGIGVHHGGLLPIIKEVVEILFSRGLVKVLFATETFAMGVNMPARTVVFNALSKHDGQSMRELLPGEYTQMSGRAGRRGLDKVGTVIIACWHEVPEAGILKRIILGKATKLESQFRLTYNMILNLLRVEDFKVEDMIKRSFSESHSQRVIPEQQALLQQIEVELKRAEDITCIFGEPDIANYQALNSELRQLDKDMQAFVLNSRQGLAALVPGRVVLVSTKMLPGALAVLIRPTVAVGAVALTAAADAPLQRSFQFLVLTGKYIRRAMEPPAVSGAVAHQLIDLPISAITSISTQRLRLDAQLDNVAIGAMTQQLLRLLEATPEGPAAMDPIKEMKIQDIDFVEKSRRRAMLYNKATQSKCHTCQKLPEQYELMDKQARLKRRMNQLRFALSDENLLLMPEFQNRCLVLQRLSYIDEDKVVQLKGRVAREMNTVNDELIATELIFENVLAELEPAEIVALMSSLLFDEKDASEAVLTERMSEARDMMIKLAVSLAHLQRECGLDVSVDEQCRKLNFNLMEVVYEWARGMPFSEIVQLTNVLEGSIVRCIVRLDETCKEVRNAARIIGDATLYRKMEEASRLIKRDIVFASSLYL